MNSPIENTARVVALLLAGRRELPQLARLLDIEPRFARRYVAALEQEGLVNCSRPHVPGRTGRPPLVIEWKGTR